MTSMRTAITLGATAGFYARCVNGLGAAAYHES